MTVWGSGPLWGKNGKFASLFEGGGPFGPEGEVEITPIFYRFLNFPFSIFNFPFSIPLSLLRIRKFGSADSFLFLLLKTLKFEQFRQFFRVA